MKRQMTPEIKIDSTAMQIELDNTKAINIGDTIKITTSFILSNRGNGNGSVLEPLLSLNTTGSNKIVLRATSEHNAPEEMGSATIYARI